jgi:hypothetical protein
MVGDRPPLYSAEFVAKCDREWRIWHWVMGLMWLLGVVLTICVAVKRDG